MKCPICRKNEVSHHVELVGFEWVEIWTLACDECLGLKEIKKNNKRVA